MKTLKGENNNGNIPKEKLCVSVEGENSMDVCLTNNLFEKEVIGLRDLRNNLSELIGKTINSFEEVLSGNVKKGGDTASIISTTLLDEILEAYKFNPKVTFDEITGQYEMVLDEIGIYASGETTEETIKILIDLVIDAAQDFYENRELYMRIPEMRKQYPYYLRVNHCKNIKELLMVLNLEIKI